jgi:hypothetical protein
MVKYAQHTTVPISTSIHAIEHEVDRYGGTNFEHVPDVEGHAYIGFQLHGEQIRVYIPLPKSESPRYSYTPSGRTRDKNAARNLFEQDRRQIYRDLYLATKFHLEQVGSQIKSGLADPATATRRAFVADLVLAEEQPTVREVLEESVHRRGRRGRTQPLLPAPVTVEAE